MKNLLALLAALALASCQPDPQTIAPASVAATAARPPFAAEIQGAAFNTTVRTGPERCGSQAFPIEGADAFEAAMREALATAQPRTLPRHVRVSAEQLSAQFAFERGVETTARPAVLLVARVTTQPASGPARTETLQRTGRSYGVVGPRCGGLGMLIADAYRDGLRDLADLVRERVRAATR